MSTETLALLVNFDLVRLSKAKREVDLAPNTIRHYGELGLRLHRVGKVVFFSRSELTNLITSGVLATAIRNAAKTKGDAR
jgi:hypothetical protein